MACTGAFFRPPRFLHVEEEQVNVSLQSLTCFRKAFAPLFLAARFASVYDDHHCRTAGRTERSVPRKRACTLRFSFFLAKGKVLRGNCSGAV